MELPEPENKKTSRNLVEEFSRSTSLTVFEIHRAAADIIPGYLLANMMSPALWKWRETRPMHDPEGNLRGANRRLKDLQREFHWYTFTNDMSKPGGDYWGLLNFDEEEERLGKDFIQTIRKDYDETLNYLLKLDPESQFGQIVLQDFYKQGYFPRLKNETIEGMNAYQNICPQGKGSGKCVALAMLWASALAVCARFPLDQIIVVANKAHLFVFHDDGETVNLFNNAKWYNKTRINNDSPLAVQARSVAIGSDVMFFYIPGKGMCDIYHGWSEVERSTIEKIAQRCGDFLGAPLMVRDLDEVDFEVNERSLPDPAAYECREAFQKAVYDLAEAEPDSPYAHAKYAYRDWRNTDPHVYAHASMREYEVGERAKTIKSLNDALEVVREIENHESIFQSRDRLALPDETLLFCSGDDRDKALLLFTLLQRSDLLTERLMVGFSDESSYVLWNDSWVDLHTLEVLDSEPTEITHMFDHQVCLKPNDILNDEAESIADRVKEAYVRFDSRESVSSGAIPKRRHEDLPPGIEEMLKIPEVGPKTVQRLWQELKINDIASLRKAAEEKRIRTLKGFGIKKEARILKNLELSPAG